MLGKVKPHSLELQGLLHLIELRVTTAFLINEHKVRYMRERMPARPRRERANSPEAFAHGSGYGCEFEVSFMRWQGAHRTQGKCRVRETMSNCEESLILPLA